MNPVMSNPNRIRQHADEIGQIDARLRQLHMEMDATERFMTNNRYDGNDVRECAAELAEYQLEITRLEERRAALANAMCGGVGFPGVMSPGRQR